MLEKFKESLLCNYKNLDKSTDSPIFIDLSPENGYPSDTEIIIQQFEFIDGYTVIAAKPGVRDFCNDSPDYYETYMYWYGLDNIDHIDRTKIQSSTIKFTSETLYKNITTYQELSPEYIYFGTFIDDEIVSVSGTNTPVLKESYTGSIVELGVQTNEFHRQKGYAVSNTTAISEYLLNHGYSVTCLIDNANVNSQKTAKSCGFELIAKEKTLWCPYKLNK